MSHVVKFVLGSMIAFAHATAGAREWSPLEQAIVQRGLDPTPATPEREAEAAARWDAAGTPALPGFAWGRLAPDERRDVALALAVEDERRAEIARMWAPPDGESRPAPTRVQVERLNELWTLLVGNGLPDAARATETRDALAARARQTPGLWMREWRDHLATPSPRLDDRLAILAEVFGRTLRVVNEARAGDRPEVARTAALDALRVVTEAYLIAGATCGERERQCDRAGNFNQMVGGPTMGLTLVGGVTAAASGSPLLTILTLLSAMVSVPTTYASFANIGRQFDADKQPLLLPRWMRVRNQRQTAERELRAFWSNARHHAMTNEDWERVVRSTPRLDRTSIAAREAHALKWAMEQIWSALGPDGADAFCARVLASSAPS